MSVRKCCGTPKGAGPHKAGCQQAFAEQGIKQPGRTPRREEWEPDWSDKCQVCGQSPIVPLTGMCGPCTFGEADTVAGNW